MAAATNLGAQFAPRTAGGLFTELAQFANESSADLDVYGEGSTLQGFEAEVSSLLGLQTGVFFTSGTQAQIAALQAHQPEHPLVAVHHTSHIVHHTCLLDAGEQKASFDDLWRENLPEHFAAVPFGDISKAPTYADVAKVLEGGTSYKVGAAAGAAATAAGAAAASAYSWLSRKAVENDVKGKLNDAAAVTSRKMGEGYEAATGRDASYDGKVAKVGGTVVAGAAAVSVASSAATAAVVGGGVYLAAKPAANRASSSARKQVGEGNISAAGGAASSAAGGASSVLDGFYSGKTKVGVLVLELPQRMNGGAVISWEDLVKTRALATKLGVKMHMDGARLWEVQPFYGKPLAEICALFDSVYVSFYKGVNAAAGAMLLGDADFIKRARLFQAQAGGKTFCMSPYTLHAQLKLRESLPQFQPRFDRMKALVVLLSDPARGLVGGEGELIRFDPPVPQSAMVHVYVKAASIEELEEGYKAVVSATGVGLWNRVRGPGHAKRIVAKVDMNVDKADPPAAAAGGEDILVAQQDAGEAAEEGEKEGQQGEPETAESEQAVRFSEFYFEWSMGDTNSQIPDETILAGWAAFKEWSEAQRQEQSN